MFCSDCGRLNRIADAREPQPENYGIERARHGACRGQLSPVMINAKVEGGGLLANHFRDPVAAEHLTSPLNSLIPNVQDVEAPVYI
jgi:hypothetical protein